MSAFTVPASPYNLFPATPNYSWSVLRTPRWKTLIQRSASDIRSAIGLSMYPVYTWELTYKLLKSDASLEFQTIMGFFNQQKGALIPFRFLDLYDNSATAHQFGVGDGTSTSWQLFRLFGGFFEPVLCPYGSAYVYINGTEQLNTAFSISNSGLVTFNTPPVNGATLAWSGTYYWICAFTEDMSDFENFAYNLWTCKKLTFENLKQMSLA